MDIIPLTSPAEVSMTIMGVVRAHGAALPDKVYAALANTPPSSVDQTVRGAEALYAAAQQLPNGEARGAAAVACIQLTGMATQWRWHALGQTDRGLKVVGACRRIIGDGDQAEADDAAVDPEFVSAG